MKKNFFASVLLCCFIILNYALTVAFAAPISLDSGDFAITIEKSGVPAVNQPVTYKLTLKNKYDSSLLSGAEIKLESLFVEKNISNIATLKEESPGVYLGSAVFSEKGQWNLAVLGTIKQDLGVYPFRAAFNESVEIQSAGNTNNYENNGSFSPDSNNNNADEELAYYGDDEQESDFGVVFVFPVIVIISLLAAFYPKFRKK